MSGSEEANQNFACDLKKISILGSTGSIGTQTLDVVRMHPENFRIISLGCKSRIDILEKQIREFHPETAAVYDEEKACDLAARIKDTDTRVLKGMDGMIAMAEDPEAELFVTGIVGMIGIRPTLAAISSGKDIALANKETLVTAGHLIMPLIKEKGVRLLPVDSEHSAIFQALQGRAHSKIRRIILTASGGPFFGRTYDELSCVTVKEALAHPTWNMGPKVTIDSATMVNKGLEVIEAKWLFNVSPEQIEVVIQRESALHSAVEYEDCSVIAQIGPSDMRIPIQYALMYPEHVPSPATPLDFSKLPALHFDKPDNKTFRGLPLAYEALKAGGSMTCAFNAANEWANARFLKGGLHFPEIYTIIEGAMAHHNVIKHPSVDEIFETEKDIFRHLDEVYGKDE